MLPPVVNYGKGGDAALDLIKEMYRLYGRHNVMRAAGALAYFFVLSVFPLILCVNELVGLAHVDVQTLLHALNRVLPQQALELVGEYVEYVSRNHPSALLYPAIPAVILSASAGLRVLLDTMDEIYEQPRDTGVRRIAMSVLCSVLFLITVYLSVVVIVTGNWFLRRLVGAMGGALADFSGLWWWLRYVLLFCFVQLLVLAVYWLGTPRGQRRYMPGSALLCSAALVVASAVFSWFIGLSARYSLLYGSLASIMILLLWLYLCGTILLLGAIFNRVWTKKHPKA